MLAKDGKVIANDGKKVRFSLRDVAIEPDTGKPVANQMIYEYAEGNERYVLTFTRKKDTLRFTGELKLEHYQAEQPLETLQDEALWELMYFGHAAQE